MYTETRDEDRRRATYYTRVAAAVRVLRRRRGAPARALEERVASRPPTSSPRLTVRAPRLPSLVLFARDGGVSSPGATSRFLLLIHSARRRREGDPLPPRGYARVRSRGRERTREVRLALVRRHELRRGRRDPLGERRGGHRRRRGRHLSLSLSLSVDVVVIPRRVFRRALPRPRARGRAGGSARGGIVRGPAPRRRRRRRPRRPRGGGFRRSPRFFAVDDSIHRRPRLRSHLLRPRGSRALSNHLVDDGIRGQTTHGSRRRRHRSNDVVHLDSELARVRRVRASVPSEGRAALRHASAASTAACAARSERPRLAHPPRAREGSTRWRPPREDSRRRRGEPSPRRARSIARRDVTASCLLVSPSPNLPPLARVRSLLRGTRARRVEVTPRRRPRVRGTRRGASVCVL